MSKECTDLSEVHYRLWVSQDNSIVVVCVQDFDYIDYDDGNFTEDFAYADREDAQKRANELNWNYDVEYKRQLELTISRMKDERGALARRLNYAELQLLREAKFKNRNRPEDQRFFRALDVVADVVAEVQNELAPNPYF